MSFWGYRGQAVRLTLVLTDGASGAAVSASDVRLRVQKPDGTEVEVLPLSDGGTGIVYGDYVPFVSGTYRYRGWRTTAPETAVEGQFTVAASLFADDPD